MASIRKYKNGWRAFVRRKGVSKTATFTTKREAQDWATKTELLILAESEGKVKRPFRDLLVRYLTEVTPMKRNANWEAGYLRRMLKHPIADAINPDETYAVEYRNERLKSVQGSTVNREMCVLSAVCSTAIKEWRWMERNPFTNVKKPRPNPHRDRRVSDEEIEKLKEAVQYEVPPKTVMQLCVHAFMLAIETAMRIGEIRSLTWDDIDFEKRTAFLPVTKNGDSRTVPLSPKALDLLRQLPVGDKYVFQRRSIKNCFWNVVRMTDIKDLHFHDSRHEAITRLSKKVDVLALARIVGHKRVNQLMTYYNESAEDIALKL